jgi:transposase
MNRKQELELLATTNFFSLAKTEQHPRDRIRLLALGHVKNGTKKQSVAEMFQIHPITLRQWLRRFFHGGIAALKEGFRSGRKKKLPANQEAFFVQEVERLQETRKGGRIRAADIQVLLKEQFCVDYALPSVYHLLERCGLSWISARSKHPKSDPIAQEDFKKNSRQK